MSPTDLQCVVDKVLLDGVNPIIERYLTDQGWDGDDVKKLAFTAHFWRESTRSRSIQEREANMQYFLAALTAHKGRKIVMPIRCSMHMDGDTSNFLNNKELVRNIGRKLFKSDEFKKFQYRTNDNIQLGDVSSLDYGVEHICPRGIVIKFEGKISYLIEKVIPKVEMFFGDPSAKKPRTKKIKDLKIEVKDEGEVSIWDKVSIKSVAMSVRYDEPTKIYTVSDRPVYVELDLGSKDVEKAFRKAGGEGNLNMASKSNLKGYVPKERWEDLVKGIEAAQKDFADKNTKLLNEANERQRSRDALEKLRSYYKNSKRLAEVDYKEPEEAEDRAANSNRAISVASGDDEDTDMFEEEL